MQLTHSKPFDRADHAHITDAWFVEWGQTPPPWELIAPTGVMVYSYGRPICAGFLTKTDAGLAIITNYISDKKIDKTLRALCLDHLSGELDQLAKDGGFKMVCVSTSMKSMADRFESLGYHKTHEQFINLGRYLWHGYQSQEQSQAES